MERSCTMIGIAASFVLQIPEIQKRNDKRRTVREKLTMADEALAEAEERVRIYEERHDRILNQICSYYMMNHNLEESLIGAKDAVNEALEFALALRILKWEIPSSFS